MGENRAQVRMYASHNLAPALQFIGFGKREPEAGAGGGLFPASPVITGYLPIETCPIEKPLGVCVSGALQSVCEGDSGGPWMTELGEATLLIGIHSSSFNRSNASQGLPCGSRQKLQSVNLLSDAWHWLNHAMCDLHFPWYSAT